MGGCCTKDRSTDTVRSKPSTRGARDRSRNNHQRRPDQHEAAQPPHILDINEANEHQLAALPGIGQKSAKAIIQYRVQHGPYQHVNDLINVQGVGPQTMNKIQDKLTVKHTAATPPINRVKGHNILRIGTWNLQCFNMEKANDPVVMETICLALLYSQVDIVAVQEVGHPSALEKICNELNHPKLQSVKAQTDIKLKWTYSISEPTGRMYQGQEYNGFLWNNVHSINLHNAGNLDGKPTPGSNRFVRRPFIGYFKVNHWEIVLVSVHLKATGLDGSDIPQLKTELGLLPLLVQAIKEQGHKDIIVLGDFNMTASDDSFDGLTNIGYTYLIPPTTPTNISGRNPHGSKQYDNLWLSTKVKSSRTTGSWGVVREGLKLRNKQETVSDHCLVWADFKK